MAPKEDWVIPPPLRPNPKQFGFDVGLALTSVVGLRSEIPEDAFTAGTLGTLREGNGVVIGADGLVLTIGYLIQEAETIWLTAEGGLVVSAHVVGYDQETGFGLVQALGRLPLPARELGDSSAIRARDEVIVAGSGGIERALRARVIGKREFAGYWEYLLDEAVFTAPAHPSWGGAAVLGQDGSLLGIGSLRVEHSGGEGNRHDVNMIVPIDLLKPVLADLRQFGRPQRPSRPWLGMYTIENQERLVVAGVSDGGPAQRAGLRVGDIVSAVAGEPVTNLASLYRRLWKLGEAGVAVPMVVERDGVPLAMSVKSASRTKFLKSPRLH
ncbi:MAG: serine protease [Proteobacteria bacterium]|nr:serine protease [Pseudomonadota bacterium]